MKIFLALTVAVAGCMVAAAENANAPTVHCASKLMDATFVKAVPGVKFEFEATIAYTHVRPNHMFAVVDGSGAAILRGRPHWTDDMLRPGDRVRVSGCTVTAHTRPWEQRLMSPNCYSIETLSHGTPPKPAEPRPGELADGTFDYRVVRISGTLHDTSRDEIDPDYMFFIVNHGGEMVYAYMGWSDEAARTLEESVGENVELEGVCAPASGGYRLHIGRHVMVCGIEKVHFTKASAKDAFDVPEINSPNRHDSPRIVLSERRRVRGRVIASWGNDNLLLRLANNDVMRVSLKEKGAPRRGETIDVAGFPETDLYRVNLTRAAWRPSGGVPMPGEPPPQSVTAGAIMRDSSGNRHVAIDMHGKCIRLSGKVMALNGGKDGSIAYVECDGFIVPVDSSSAPEAMDGLAEGCVVEITGTCVLDIENWRPAAPFPRVKSFMVVVGEASDVRVVSWPPWWTPGRFMAVIGALIAVIAGIFAYNRSLNRLAERRGRELTEETVAHITANLKVEERTRLAIELHDSLSQNLTGAALEIETSDALIDTNASLAHMHLGIAAKTVKSCREELRNCLWDLRSDALGEKTMDAAIRKTLAHHVGGAALSVRFNVPRDRLSDNTAHTLLRIIRELVQNAIRHGHAKTVRIAGSLESDRLLFSVQDDGCGFDPKNHPDVPQGHFGLQGIKERVNQFGGELTMVSGIGQGAKMTISLPLGGKQ